MAANLFNLLLLLAIAAIAWTGQWFEKYPPIRFVVYVVMILSAMGMIGLGGVLIHFQQNVLGALLLVMAACAIPALFPPVRRLLEKYLFPGLNPNHPTHSWSLFVYFAVLTLSIFSLTALYRPDVIIQQLKETPLYETALLNVIAFVLFSFIASGWGACRSFSEVTVQLGLTAVPWKRVGWMLLLALLLAVVIQVVEMGLMHFLDPQTKHVLEEIVKAMNTSGSFGHTLLSALIVGAAAGFGEEVLFRGLMQPLFGIFPTALLFACIHTHYGPTPLLLELFILGILLGYVRKRYNTTCTIIIHSGFDFFAIMSSLIHH